MASTSSSYSSRLPAARGPSAARIAGGGGSSSSLLAPAPTSVAIRPPSAFGSGRQDRGVGRALLLLARPGAHERGDQAPFGLEQRAQALDAAMGAGPGRGAHRPALPSGRAAKAAAAASSVRPICSPVWASEGNQASNCEGGGYTPRPSSSRHQLA